MNFSYINKISLYLSLIFIFSCQNTNLLFGKKDTRDFENDIFQFEKKEIFDFNSFEDVEINIVDKYTYHSSSYNFLDKNLNKIKIKNYGSKDNINSPINVIFLEDIIYSINTEAELLKFDIITGKLLEKISIGLDTTYNTPVSFSLYKKDFIIAFKSGEVARINKIGQIIWKFKNQNLLNTPIKIYDDNLIILYPEKIIFLKPSDGNIIYEQVFKSSNIIQSSGGKIDNYYNIIFFILSNSEFNAIDTFTFEEHKLNFHNIVLNTSLNNLNDKIHIYKNFLVYFDDGNNLHTYDINKDEFILTNFRINNSNSAILFNNALISMNENYIDIYNIKNGNLFSKFNINKILNKKSVIINVLIINDRVHLFADDGNIIIFDQNLNIEKTVNLKIKNINQVYSYQNKIFISTDKGITHIY